MSTVRLCRVCGASLPADAPEGLCPKCLMKVAAGDSSTVGDGSCGAEPRTSNVERSTLNGTGNTTRVSPRTTDHGQRTTIRYFGDYELLGEIARGGMGVVYKARQVSLNRVVAVKMILAGELAGEAEVKRFHTEAEAAANLQHPNIVAIHEIGEHEGQHYFSMDYVEGKNLAQVAAEGPLPMAKAAAYMKGIAEAIHYAHQRGTLHRDLKPQNVLIDALDQPRITDFGLAKRLERDSGLTQSGAVMGSPSYMPPEQAAGRQGEIGPASDVYSLGAVLYQLLTGRAPFRAETPTATLVAVMNEPVTPPSRLNAQVARDLETICLKCMEKRPERRYPSARALAEELERFLTHRPILARPASPARKAWDWGVRNPWVLMGATAVLVLVLIGLAYGLLERLTFLQWKVSAPHSPVPRRFDLSDTAAVWMLFLSLPLELLVLGGFLELKRRGWLGRPVVFELVVASSVAQVLFAIYLVLVYVKQIAWERNALWADSSLFLGMTSVPLAWFGMSILWEAVRHRRAAQGYEEPLPPSSLPAYQFDSGAFVATGLLAMLVVGVIGYCFLPTNSPSESGRARLAASIIPTMSFAMLPISMAFSRLSRGTEQVVWRLLFALFLMPVLVLAKEIVSMNLFGLGAVRRAAVGETVLPVSWIVIGLGIGGLLVKMAKVRPAAALEPDKRRQPEVLATGRFLLALVTGALVLSAIARLFDLEDRNSFPGAFAFLATVVGLTDFLARRAASVQGPTRAWAPIPMVVLVFSAVGLFCSLPLISGVAGVALGLVLGRILRFARVTG